MTDTATADRWDPRLPWARNRWGNIVDADGDIVIEVGDGEMLDFVVAAVNRTATSPPA